jgi:acyl dehydratase
MLKAPLQPEPFDLDVLGRRFEAPEFHVTADRIAAYAAATNDPSPAAAAGELAPPVFAFVPLRPALRQVLGAATPLYAQHRGLHGEQDIRIMSPIEPGATLFASGTLAGIRARPTGTALVLNLQTRDAGGTLVNDQFTTIYFPRAEAPAEAGVDAPGHRLPAGTAERPPRAELEVPTDLDQTYRYADASGDTGVYHLDDEAARRVGFDGIILHGMCTMATVSASVLAEVGAGDVSRVSRVAVRFAHPVVPGERLVTRVWDDGGDAVAFETYNPDGVRVLAHGRLELADAVK